MGYHGMEGVSRKKWLLAATLILAIAGRGQTNGTDVPKFEVASIRRNLNCGNRRGGRTPGSPGRVTQECMTIAGLVMTAYGVWVNGVTYSSRVPDVTGGPDWIRSETYDIVAKAEGDAPFPQMAGPMLQALLEDRFKLKIHRETKEVPVYFLSVAKDGHKLQPTREGSCVPIDSNRPPAQNAAPGQPRPIYCGPGYRIKDSTMTVMSHGGTIEQLTDALLSHMLERPVIDKTGLSGQYDFQAEFEYYPNSGVGDAGASGPDAGPQAASIFKVFQDKLGLKLEPGRGLIDIIVIDHVERPTAN